MPVEDALRLVAFTIVRFSVFASQALIFGIVPVALAVIRPSLLGLAGWEAGRARLAARLEGLVQASMLTAFVATLVGLFLQAVLVSSLGAGDLDPSAFDAVVSTTFGRWYLVRLPLLALLAVVVARNVSKWSLSEQKRTAWWAAWAAIAAALLATTTFSGHSAVATPRPLAIVGDVVHLLAGATWFSGIVVLAVALPDALRGKDDAARLQLLAPAAMRFSLVALVSIVVLALTGTLNSFLHLERLRDLVATPYGRALTVKLVLFAVILILGGVNHLVLRERLRRSVLSGAPTDAARKFRRVVALELVVALALLGATGVLTGLARTKESAAPAATASLG